MPRLPLVLRMPQRGSHTCAAKILIPEQKIPSHTGRNNFRPAGRQPESMAATANYVQAQVFHLEEQVRTRFLFQTNSYCTTGSADTSFLPSVLQNSCNFTRLSFHQVSLAVTSRHFYFTLNATRSQEPQGHKFDGTDAELV